MRNTHLLELPPEILLLIMLFLAESNKQALGELGATCREANALVDELFWKFKLTIDFFIKDPVRPLFIQKMRKHADKKGRLQLIFSYRKSYEYCKQLPLGHSLDEKINSTPERTFAEAGLTERHFQGRFWYEAGHFNGLKFCLSQGHSIEDSFALLDGLSEAEADGIGYGLQKSDIQGQSEQVIELLSSLDSRPALREHIPALAEKLRGIEISQEHRQTLLWLLETRKMKPLRALLEINNLPKKHLRSIESGLTRSEIFQLKTQENCIVYCDLKSLNFTIADVVSHDWLYVLRGHGGLNEMIQRRQLTPARFFSEMEGLTAEQKKTLVLYDLTREEALVLNLEHARCRTFLREQHQITVPVEVFRGCDWFTTYEHTEVFIWRVAGRLPAYRETFEKAMQSMRYCDVKVLHEGMQIEQHAREQGQSLLYIRRGRFG